MPAAVLPSADACQPPSVPGYALETMLGRGGSGEVWRAVPKRGGDPVAVKVLVAGDPQRQAREAALLGELDHPHLVRLVEVVHSPRLGATGGVALVLELLPGGSLAALLARRGRLRPGEVVTAIAPVAAALAHAHDNGVVHGDLSPGNIVFTAEGRPVLTDLGVARVLGETATGEVTPAYVDPTVARGGAPGPASDVFGIAAAAFHALSGVAPWNAATPADTLAVAAAGILPDLAELAPDAPAGLVEVIRRGLAPDPHERGSAASFALDLRHACRPEPVRLPVTGVPDGELAATGRGPRTELTHQVPGRRPRPAPAVVEALGRRELFRDGVRDRLRAVGRPAGVRTAAVVVVVAALAGSAWLGLRWTGEREPGPVGASPAAATADAPRAAETASPLPPVETADTQPAPADSQTVPASVDAWTELVQELYDRRAAAFATASAGLLDDVYTAGSVHRRADEDHLRSLAAAGEALRGFAADVVEVRAVAAQGADTTSLELVDRRSGYEVVLGADPDGAALRTVAGRPDATVVLVLVRTPDGWRIERAERIR